jgi:hypothetical protein
MNKILYSLLTMVYIYVMPVYPLIGLIGIFIFTDTIFGVYKSYKLKESIVSRKLARIVSKLIIYTSVVLLTFGLDVLIIKHLFTYSPYLVTKFIAGVLCCIEIFSIDEKIRLFNNNKGIKFYLYKVLDFAINIRKKTNEIIN